MNYFILEVMEKAEIDEAEGETKLDVENELKITPLG